MIPGDLLSAFPHRQFHTLPGLLDSWAALPNSYPNACMPMQGGSLYHFYDGLWYDPAERRTHDLPCERRTRYRLSQPDTVNRFQSRLLRYRWLSKARTLSLNPNRGNPSECVSIQIIRFCIEILFLKSAPWKLNRILVNKDWKRFRYADVDTAILRLTGCTHDHLHRICTRSLNYNKLL